MSANQPTSFRFPFKLPPDTHAEIANAIRYTFSGLKDANDAIKALNNKVGANTAAVATVTNNVTQVAGGGGGGGTAPVFGGVNLQPNLTPGSYVLAQSDLGGLVLVQSSVPFALNLNSGLTLPFFTTVYNLGSGLITATPSTGLVNNLASINIPTGQWGIFFWDGANWWDAYSILAQTFAAVPFNWLRSYDATTGLFTASQPAASDLSNGTTGTGAVVLASALPTAILSGTSGSLGGSPLTVGQTVTITVAVTGATTGMAVAVSPQTYPGDGFDWDAYISAPNTVTVRLTAVIVGTPSASLYNVRVIQ